MMEESEGQELAPSELGTKEYWDNAYCDGIKHFKESGIIDEGWFGEDSGLRMVKWLCSSECVKQSDYIADLGCGNGVLLLELAKEGFTNLKGLDYSTNAIQLAKVVAAEQKLSIDYEVIDLLQENTISEVFDVCLDKGTYDAVSLSGGNTRQKRICYIENVGKLLKQGGILLITSCNWTQQELLSHFESGFALHTVVPTPTFKFGGKTGNLVTTLVLMKK